MCLFLVTLIMFVFFLSSLHRYSYRKHADLSSDVILITGAANGIGRLLALSLSRLCKNIVVIDKDFRGLEETSNLVLKQNHVKLICYVCDLNDRDALRKCARTIRENNGRITILICNAGILNGNYLLDIPTKKVEKLINVNLMAPFYLIKEFLPGMLGNAYGRALDRIPKKLRVEPVEDISEKCFPEAEPRGHLVFMSSVASQWPCLALADYCASKAGMSALVDSLRLEMNTLGMSEQIFFTDIRPYVVDTGLLEGFSSKLSILPIQKPEKVVDRIVEAIRYRERIVYIPSIAWFLPIIQKTFPFRVLFFIYKICGALDQMNAFGRSNKNHD